MRVACRLRIFCALMLLGVLALGAVNAQAPWSLVELEPGEETPLPATTFRVLSELPADTPLASVIARLQSGASQRPDHDILNEGVTWNMLWAMTDIENTGAEAAAWQVRTPLTAAGDLQIVLLRDSAAPQPLLDASFRRSFDSRPVDSRKLISAPFILEAGETARLAIGYRPLGFSRLPLWLTPPEQAEAWVAKLARHDAVFYAGAAVLIGCFLGFCLVIRNATGVSLAGLLVLNLAVLAQFEGHLFRFVWPGAPLFNLNATLPLMLIAAACGYLIALLTGRKTPGTSARRAIWSALGASLASLAATPFAHPALILPVSLGLWTGAFAAIAYTLPGWTQFTPLQQRIGQVVAGIMVLASLSFVLAGLSAVAPAWTTSDLPLRVSYLLASGGLMTLLLMQVSGLYRAHQDGLQSQIEAARKEAELNTALLQSERSYTEAMRRAAQARQQLAAASHDIQQPLSALRLLLQRDPQTWPDDVVDDALGYVDRLARAISADSADGEPDAPPEAYDLGMVVRAAAEMFRDEAQGHGIRLQVQNAEVLTDVPTVAVMRVVSNLIVNAIRHSGGDIVTLGLTASPDQAQVSVTNDGTKLTPDAFAEYLARGRKGAMSQGDGLGLSIIAELCAKHGMDLSLDDSFNGGTRLVITLPRPSNA